MCNKEHLKQFQATRIHPKDRVIFVGDGFAQPLTNDVVNAVSERTRKVGFASSLHEATADAFADHVMLRSPADLKGKWVTEEMREAVDEAFSTPPAPTFVHLHVTKAFAFPGHFYVPPPDPEEEGGLGRRMGE